MAANAPGAASAQSPSPTTPGATPPTGTTDPDAGKVKLNKDNDGNLIDPPVIASYERELADAHATGDQDLIDGVMDNYTKARVKLATAHAKRAQGGGR